MSKVKVCARCQNSTARCASLLGVKREGSCAAILRFSCLNRVPIYAKRSFQRTCYSYSYNAAHALGVETRNPHKVADSQQAFRESSRMPQARHSEKL
eukprot:6466091-Amphidinium_carterae.1